MFCYNVGPMVHVMCQNISSVITDYFDKIFFFAVLEVDSYATEGKSLLLFICLLATTHVLLPEW